MSLRIGLDGTPLLGNRSGVGNYTGRLLAALLRANPEWEFLLYSNRPLGGLEPELDRAVQVDGYLSLSRWLWMQTRLPALIHRSQPDLCHFTNALAPLARPRPFVITIHDASLFLYSHYHPWTRLLTMRALLPLLARRATAVITVSHHARQDLLRVLKLPPDKIQVIHEAAPDGFRPVTDAAALERVRTKYRLPPAFILYVGTLEPRKNLGRLVRAMRQVQAGGFRHRLVMVGPQGWMMDGFEQEIERLDLKDAVQLTGFVPAEDLPALFSLATLFVFPSLYEGFGLPPLEAMACGTPVLSSNSSSLAEICGDAAYLVDPTDEEALAEGILGLLNDEAWRGELARRGRERAAQFSWAQAAEKTAAVYRAALNGAN